MKPGIFTPRFFRKIAGLSFTILLTVVFSIGLTPSGRAAQESGKPAQSLTVYAICEPVRWMNEKGIRSLMDDLLSQFGAGNAWHHPGLACIYSGFPQFELIAKIAKEKGVSLGLIFGIQTHTGGQASHNFFAQDLRSFQWRMNSPHWEGYFTGKNNDNVLEIAEQGRDFQVPSPSRYSPLAQQRFQSLIRTQAREVHRIMEDHPGVITCINGVIEEELAVAASALKTPDADNYLGDYSPFAVTEFRDWLRHTGMYDDDGGKYAGQGAPEAITGPFIEHNGRRRSPFYDDPNPDQSNGTGLSFNATFGTRFTTWNLKYWDTTLFPGPITDRNFNPMPQAGGKGFTAGGFDAPRRRDPSRWWRAWSWDYHDEGNTWPPGNPAAPAFGFRQCLVAHFVRDMFDVMASEGLPRDIMYAHQIPAEHVDPERCRSSASPVWTGYLPASGSVGVTCFGQFDPRWALQYSNLTPDNHGWGIFEWHPLPRSGRDDPKLYNAAMIGLIVYSRNNCRHLFAGWWDLKGKNADPKQIFWLNDSKFAEAIKTFMASTPDNPPPMPAESDAAAGKIR